MRNQFYTKENMSPRCMTPTSLRRRYHEMWPSGVIDSVSNIPHLLVASAFLQQMHHRSQTKTHLPSTSHFNTKTHQGIWEYHLKFNRSSVVCSVVWCDTFLILTFMNWDPTRCARGWPWDHHLSSDVVSDAIRSSSTSCPKNKHRMAKLDNWPTNINTPYILPKQPCMPPTANILMKLSSLSYYSIWLYCIVSRSSQFTKMQGEVGCFLCDPPANRKTLVTRKATGSGFWNSIYTTHINKSQQQEKHRKKHV